MALMPKGHLPQIDGQNIAARVGIAQDSKPTPEQLAVQVEVRDAIRGILVYVNRNVEDGRAKSLGMTALEDGLMWIGKQIFAPPKERE